LRVKRLFVWMLAGLVSSSVHGQVKMSKDERKAEKRERINQLIKQEEEGALVFDKQSTFYFRLNTDGWGIGYEKGKYKSAVKSNLWWIDIFGERRSPKEESVTNIFGGGGFVFLGNPFRYGKINNLYTSRLGFGQQYLIGGKGNKNGVAVSAIYGGGLSVGWLKPYYIEVEDPSTGQATQIRYNNNDSIFLDFNSIIGGAGLFKGFNEIKPVPGVHARAALRFDNNRFNETVGTLEVGLTAEYYTQGIQTMALNPERKFFLNAYLAIVFGRRK